MDHEGNGGQFEEDVILSDILYMPENTKDNKEPNHSSEDELSHERLEFVLSRKQMLNAHGNSHWRAKIGHIKFLRDLGRETGEDAKQVRDIFFDKFEIIVTVKPPTRRKLDPPNFYPTIKPIIDGLTDAGWWEDDNYAHMMETRFRYGGLSGVTKADGTKDSAAFRVILDIIEIKDSSEYITESEFID